MTEQRSATAPAQRTKVRVIHAAITAGVVTLFGVFLYLKTRLGFEPAADNAGSLKWAGIAILAGAAFGSHIIRSRIPSPVRGTDFDEWWRVNLQKATMSWAIAEGGSLAAIVIGWLTGDTTLMALGAGVALALLFVNRPGALEGTA